MTSDADCMMNQDTIAQVSTNLKYHCDKVGSESFGNICGYIITPIYSSWSHNLERMARTKQTARKLSGGKAPHSHLVKSLPGGQGTKMLIVSSSVRGFDQELLLSKKYESIKNQLSFSSGRLPSQS